MKRTLGMVVALSALVAGGLGVGAVVGGSSPTPVSATVDPARTAGTSLAEAASQPRGIGDQKLAEKATQKRGRVAVRALLRSKEAARGGCWFDYGEADQCLPLVPPSHAGMGGGVHRWTCAELNAYFPAGLRVNDTGGRLDPLRLDADGDGVACGAED